MIDVIYKLGVGSKFEDKELRYSLRSLSNFKDLGNVFIIGHQPNWINYDHIIHIQAQDCYLSNKDANLINKIILACLDNRLSDQFLHFSDDQVLLQQVDKVFFERPLVDNSHISNITGPGKKLNRWQQRLQNTVNKLKERGYQYNCYEAHIPYLIDKNKYPGVLFRYDYGFDRGYCGNTLYFNTTKAHGKDKRECDVARIEKQHSLEQLIKFCDNKLIFNYTDGAINQDLFVFLQKQFPNKSKYEL